MRRVLGAGLIVVMLGGGHLVHWIAGRAVSESHPSDPARVSAAPPGSVTTPRAAPADPSAGRVPGRFQTDPLGFLSTAPADSLDLLPGIGPVLARRIVTDRNARGPFTAWTELDRVRGIGSATVRRLQGAARRP